MHRDREPGDDRLEEAIAMRLGSRFFVDEPEGEDGSVGREMIASSLHVDFS